MKDMPKIEKFMTAMPHSINKNLNIKKAFELMREHQIRHLPVQEGGTLVGVLTDRDVKLAGSFQGTGDLLVEDVMTPDPYVVMPETPVNQVASEMCSHKYGCAVVTQKNGKVVGIFTSTDGMRVLSDILNKNYKETP
jgi:acetoin utilization protein AcuB